MNTKKLEQLKKAYWQIKLSDQQVSKGWQNLQFRMKPESYHFQPTFTFLGLILVFGLLAGVVSAASPASLLYPVRVLADKVIAQVANKPELKLERRVDDVVVSLKKPAQFEKAGKAYEKTLNEVKNEAQKDDVKIKGLQKGLNEAEEKLDKAIKEEPKSKSKIRPILEKTQEVKLKLKHKED